MYIVSPSSFAGKYIDCGNMHSVSNIKNYQCSFLDNELLISWN